MALDANYLRYPHRGYGMDHSRYDWSMQSERAPIEWPGGAGLAVWINLAVQFFPLNQQGKPFAPPGGMTTAYPDLRHFTLREYGNRVGIVRCWQALDKFGIAPTHAVNSIIAERYPRLLERICERRNEILCHSWHMDSLHHGDLESEQEAEIIERSLERLRGTSGQAVSGWLSPGGSQSAHTPDLLARHGIEYMGDWINDDLPYPFHTEHGDLVALPLSLELDDHFIIGNNLHSEWEYADQVKDACDFLLAEAENGGGRMLALNVHPWLMGQPHRIAAFESALEHIARKDGIWSASASEIVAAWKAGQ